MTSDRRFLVFGGSGLIGSVVLRCLEGAIVHAPSKSDVDVSDAGRVDRYIQDYRPDVVINCAVLKDVDEIELSSSSATRVNVHGTENIVQSLQSSNAILIHLSADYVFDGYSKAPYRESDVARPVNEYGKTKLASEAAARQLTDGGYVVRTSWVFDHLQSCFVSKVRSAALQGVEVKAVQDQRGSPTFAYDLARAILEIDAKRPPSGVYHVSNHGSASWHDLAVATLKLAGSDSKPVAVPASSFESAARRPMMTALDTTKWGDEGMTPLRHWQEALAASERALNSS